MIIACAIDLDTVPTEQYVTVLAGLGKPETELTEWTYNGGDSHTYTAVMYHPQDDGSHVRTTQTGGIGDFMGDDWQHCRGLSRDEWDNYLATEMAA